MNQTTDSSPAAASATRWDSTLPILGWAGIAWQEDYAGGTPTTVAVDDPDRFVEAFGAPATVERAREMLIAHAVDIPLSVYDRAAEQAAEIAADARADRDYEGGGY